jgi:uncharacterized protein
MSETNKQIVEKINESFTQGNSEGFLENCSEDVVWSMVGETTKEGKTAIREWMSQMEGTEPPKFTVDEMIAEGDSVACRGDMTMKDEKGVDGKYSYVDFYRFRDGKVTELNSYVVKQKTEGEKDRTATA